jgi:hypothetical protein
MSFLQLFLIKKGLFIYKQLVELEKRGICPHKL